MEQRDIIKDQIEQLGRVLGKLIANFFALKAEGNVDLAIETTNQQLKSELDLDTAVLANFNAQELEEYVKSKKLTDRHLDKLASYFFEIGNANESEDRVKWFVAAKELLNLADSHSDTLTFGRINLKNRIEDEL